MHWTVNPAGLALRWFKSIRLHQLKGGRVTFERWWEKQESFQHFHGIVGVIVKHRIAEEAFRAGERNCMTNRELVVALALCVVIIACCV